MSEETTKRIIEVEVDQTKAISSIVEYGNKIKEITAEEKTWQDQLKKGQITQEEYDKKMAASNEVKKEYRRIVAETSKEIQNSLKQDKAKSDSLKSMRSELSNATKSYDEMSKAERDSAQGMELLKHINDLTAQIKGVEEATGRYQRNVGNYKNALIETGAAFKQAGVSTGAFDMGLKALNANPWSALLMAAVTIIRNVIEAFKGNEGAVMALKQAFSAFNPIIDAAKRGLEMFANVIVKVVTATVNGLTSAIGWLLDKVQQVGNFFGADWHVGDNFREGVKAAQELQAAENEYIKHKREWQVESAKIDRDVADLRAKVAEKDKYTAQERIAFLDQAIALETEKAEKEKQFAEENLRMLQQEAERSSNDTEMYEKLAEAERAVIEADTNLSNKKRELNAQRAEAIKSTKSLTKASKEHAEAVKDETEAVKDNTEALARQNEEYRKQTLTEMQKAEDDINDIIIDAIEKRRAIEDTQFARKEAQLTASMEAEREAHGESSALYQAYYLQLEALREKHEQTMAAISNDEIANEAKQAELEWQNRLEQASLNGENVEQMILDHFSDTLSSMTQIAGESDAEFYARRLEAQRAFNEQKQKLNDAEVAMEKAKANYLANIAGSISSLMESVAGDNVEMVRASKIVALAEVAIKQGQAIAEAVASASEGDPYTYAFRVAAAIASTVAAMAQAIQSINSVKLARGTDYVNGPGTSTSDSIPAMLSKGEGVVNARANAMYPGVVAAMNAAGNAGVFSPALEMLRKSNGAPVQLPPSSAIDSANMAAAFRAAIEDLNISVSVDEIAEKQNRVKSLEILSSI